NNGFKIIGRAEPALTALYVDDGAERTLERAAAAKIEASMHAARPPHCLEREERDRLSFERGKALHVIVDGLEPARIGIAEHLIECAILGLAGKDRSAHLLGLPDLRQQLP